MIRLKFISAGMVILGFISFVGGVSFHVKELSEYGMYAGILGIIGYAVFTIMRSFGTHGHEQGAD